MVTRRPYAELLARIEREPTTSCRVEVLRTLRDAVNAEGEEAPPVLEAELGRLLVETIRAQETPASFVLDDALPLVLSLRGGRARGGVAGQALVAAIDALPAIVRPSVRDQVVARAIEALAPRVGAAYVLVIMLGGPSVRAIGALGALEEAIVREGGLHAYEADLVAEERARLSRDGAHLAGLEARSSTTARGGISRASLLGESGDLGTLPRVLALLDSAPPKTSEPDWEGLDLSRMQRSLDLDGYFTALAESNDSGPIQDRILDALMQAETYDVDLRDAIQAIDSARGPAHALERAIAAGRLPRVFVTQPRHAEGWRALRPRIAALPPWKEGTPIDVEERRALASVVGLDTSWMSALASAAAAVTSPGTPCEVTDPSQLGAFALDGLDSPWDRLALADLVLEQDDPTPEALLRVERLTQDAHGEIARAAVRALAHHAPLRARELVESWASKDAWHSRALALWSAPLLPEASPALEALSHDAHAAVRRHVRRSKPRARRDEQLLARAKTTLRAWLVAPDRIDPADAWAAREVVRCDRSAHTRRWLLRRAGDPRIPERGRRWLEALVRMHTPRPRGTPWASWQGRIRNQPATWVSHAGARVAIELLSWERRGELVEARASLTSMESVLHREDAADGYVIGLRDPLEREPHTRLSVEDDVRIEIPGGTLRLRAWGLEPHSVSLEPTQ